MKGVGIVPKTSGYDKYPFSLSFLLQCYTRCLSRVGHPIFNSQDPLRLLKILVPLYKQYANVELRALVPETVRVELTTVARLPQDLEKLLATVL